MITKIAAIAIFVAIAGFVLFMKFRKKKVKWPDLVWKCMIGFGAYVDWLELPPKWLDEQVEYGFNLTRIWPFDPWQNIPPGEMVATMPYKMVDGLYDLSQFNEDLFKKLKKFCEYARARGVIVIVSLFDDCGLKRSDVYGRHAYNPKNNIQHSMGRYAIYDVNNTYYMEIVEQYIDKVMATIGHLDNIIYEYVNEGPGAANHAWCSKMKAIVEGKHGKAGYTAISGGEKGYSTFYSPHRVDHPTRMNAPGDNIYSTDGATKQSCMANLIEMIQKCRNENKHLEMFFGCIGADGGLRPDILQKIGIFKKGDK